MLSVGLSAACKTIAINGTALRGNTHIKRIVFEDCATSSAIKKRSHSKELKEPGTRLRPADIEVGSVSFKPGALLLKQLQSVTFKIDNHCLEPTDAESLDMALYEYFAEKGNEAITVKQFAILCGYKETAARALLKEYIAQGVMEHIPMSRGYYRPTKGNFGRE